MSVSEFFKPPIIWAIKYRFVVEKFGPETLHTCILSCCTDTMEEIANKCAQNSITKIGQKGKPEKISLFPAEKSIAAIDKSGLSFDITFLFKILSLIDVQFPNFYKKIREIKETRNTLMHGFHPIDKKAEYEKLLSEFEKMCIEVLNEGEVISNAQKQSLINQTSMQKNLDEIVKGLKKIQDLKARLGPEIVKIRNESIEEARIEILEYLKTSGQEEIRSSYEQLLYANPVEFFIGTKYKLLISEFYTELEFHDNDNHCAITHDDVIYNAMNFSDNVVIEGVAGIGKTTLIKKIMSLLKVSSTSNILVHFDCRNNSFFTLKEYLCFIMPKASSIFSQDKLVSAIISIKPVFLVDGLDELNESSKKILKEIVEFVKRKEATVFATSRPEGVKNFLRSISGMDYRYIELRGVHEGKEKQIVEKYMTVFSPFFTSTIPPPNKISQTLAEVKSTFKERIKIPLILCLVIYLIMSNKNVDSKKSLSDIYNMIIEALLEKLKSRIANSDDADVTEFEREMMAEDYLKYICELSLKMLKNNEMLFPEHCKREFVQKVKSIFGRFREDTLSCFFVCRGSVSDFGVQSTSYSFPHRSFQEFLAAKHLAILAKPTHIKISDHLGREILSKENMLIFLIGNLSLENSLRQEICEYIVTNIVKWDVLSVDKGHDISYFGGISFKELNNMNLVCTLLRESNNNKLMVKALSNVIRNIFLQSDKVDFEIYLKIFEEECPVLKRVRLHIVLQNEISNLIKSILSHLKTKNLNLFIRFIKLYENTPTSSCDEYVKQLSNPSCRVFHLEGYFGEEAVHILPEQQIILLYPLIESEREAKGLDSLSNLMKEEKISIQKLCLKIPRRIPSEMIPLLLSSNQNYDMSINLHGLETPEDLHWAFDVAKKILLSRALLCEQHNKRDVWLNLLSAKMYEEFKLFLEKLEQENIYLSDVFLECDNPLSQQELTALNSFSREKLHCTVISGNSSGGHDNEKLSEQKVQLLPAEIKELRIRVEDEADIKALECLRDRIEASNLTSSMRIEILHIGVHITNKTLLIKKLPIPHQFLSLIFSSFLESVDIPWLLRVLDGLPRKSDKQCKKIIIWFKSCYFNGDDLRTLEEELSFKFQSMILLFCFADQTTKQINIS